MVPWSKKLSIGYKNNKCNVNFTQLAEIFKLWRVDQYVVLNLHFYIEK